MKRICGNTLITCVLRKLALGVLAVVVNSPLLSAQSEQVLYSFSTYPSGYGPQSGPVMDKAGNLYGTTSTGGQFGAGTVFELTPPSQSGSPWTETTLYPFTGGTDGSFPVDNGYLALDNLGNLYGTTSYGGEFECGTVFQLSPGVDGTWTESVLYSFGGGTDAEFPVAGLTRKGKVFYGTTRAGGEFGEGAVFQLSPPKKPATNWSESVLYSFTGGADGGTPTAAPVVRRGKLYGTTFRGGNINGGTVYELSPPAKGSEVWTEAVLRSFDSGPDGVGPLGGVILDEGGALYGTDNGGGEFNGGVVFKLAPTNWSETVLYNFTDGTDGAYPSASLIFGSRGVLYGTTAGYGMDHGSVFQLAPPEFDAGAWTETTLYSFTGGADGGAPMDGLMLANGLLYGTTAEGGPDPRCGCGVVFQIEP